MIRFFSPAGFFKARALGVIVLGAFSLALLAGCFGRSRDPFTLQDRDINPNELNTIGEGYAWTAVKLGNYMNGHGLPASRFTCVIVRKKSSEKPVLVWPVFAYGQNQANAAVLNGKALFGATLPDGKTVLMADAGQGPPLVVSPAILRLAARRLGTLSVVPGRDCAFGKVRSIPGRIWLQACKPGDYSSGEKYFSLELTSDDMTEVINETRQRGTLITMKGVRYIAEAGRYSHIEAEDVKDAPASPPAPANPARTKPRKGEAFTPQGDQPRGQALVDSKNHFAYFATGHEPGRILKVDLASKTGNGPAVVGALVLEPEEDNPFYCAMDEQAGYAYFGTDYPGKLVKVALGAGAEPPTRIGSVLLDEQNNVHAGVVDSGTGYACFNVAQRLCKVRLGEGDEPPSLACTLDLPAGPSREEFVSAVFDPTSHCAYFGTDYKHIYKVNLGAGDAPPRIIGILTLPEDEQGLRGALIDPRNGYAWFTSHFGYIVKIALGAPDQPPTRLGSLKLDQRYQYLEYTFGIDEQDHGYYGAMSAEVILKVALGTKDELPRLTAFLPLPENRNYIPSFRAGVVDSRDRTMCLGLGSTDSVLMRLALSDGGSPPRIVDEVKLFVK